MRKPLFDSKIFAQRRKQLAQRVKDSVVIIPAHPEQIRNNDVHQNYRQDSNLFYFTGYEEPNSVLVFRPGSRPECTLFVMPRDPNMETWNGFRFGPEGAKEQFGVDETYPIDKFDELLPNLLKDHEHIYYSMFINRDFDDRLSKLIERMGLERSRTNLGHVAISDLRPVAGELRLVKSDFEVDLLKTACDVSSKAHIEVMKSIRPGVTERALQGVFLKTIMENGCAREGYGSILATGANATTLHYTFNDDTCKDGDLFLIDAGGEFKYYTADITRTYPVTKTFSDTQKRVYSRVLETQKKIVSMVKPGVTREELQKEAISQLTDLMIDEKLLTGNKKDLIEKKEYMKFYPHGIGHWLGMDVHDTGVTLVNGEPRPLEPGFVLTIEPGLYIPVDAVGVPDELRGIGIRIEDNILVTKSGHENLTQACPKEVSDLESM